jgi:hypothetical protein
LPKDLNSPGRRLAPKSNKTIRKIRRISGPLIFWRKATVFIKIKIVGAPVVSRK